MQLFDNKTQKVGYDLKNTIGKNTKLSVAAAIFSIYGFDSLKKELSNIDELNFIFTDGAFIEKSNNKKEKKLFEIKSDNIKKAISGTDFEINLKNKMKGRKIAKECKKWIDGKVKFKSNISGDYIQEQFIVDNNDQKIIYQGIEQFSSSGFGFENDNSIIRNIIKINDYQMSKSFLDSFNQVWNDNESLKDITEEVVDYISNLYKENSPEFVYYFTLYNIFDEFLEDISEDELANEKTGFKESVIWNQMFDFQKDAVLGIINKLERYNGCILADSVGLGKTFSALGVIKYYQERNKSILVLSPKKLGDNWLTFLNNYEDNLLVKDRLNYDVLYHTDLSRNKGDSNGIDLSRINWGNYDLIVIDESHNFRNNVSRKDKTTRYQKLLNNIIKKGVKTKVLMLSATPVNNKFTDLKNQISLAYEGNTNIIDEKMEVSKSIDTILSNAQRTFNEWSKLDLEKRTSTELLKRLNINFDFFKLLDGITIARSRKHIEKYYDISKIGNFPNRLKPKTIRSNITNLESFISIKELYESLSKLNMSVYNPFNYILPSKINFYDDIYDTNIDTFRSLKQNTREQSLQKLMKVNFLKRLESSIDSFRITLGKYILKIEDIIANIEKFEKYGTKTNTDLIQYNEDDIDEDNDDWIDDEFSVGNKVKINLEDMDTLSWKQDLQKDLYIASEILEEMNFVEPQNDSKLNDLKEIIKNKIENPINEGNKKIIIFTAFTDTANYLYQNLIDYNKNFGLQTAKISGDGVNECSFKTDKQFNNLLINFSPISKSRSKSKENNTQIDILIATDCISEGQNLQDCDYLINYDIHWNPVRIIQRFGRIDRIGSQNKDIQLVNFRPQLSLDDYIDLKNRVENKMNIVGTTATGENILTNKSSDLEFRKKQLEKLQNEVVDIEDMDTGISIMDLGLNDFRMDLINYINQNGKFKGIPYGMHTVCKKNLSKGIDEGVIFILKNINNEINIENTNQLHPFYVVYINKYGKILSNHINVKHTLDVLKSISKGYNEAIKEVYELFNEETQDGKYMDKYSELLNQSIQSIISIKNETDIDSLFNDGGTSDIMNNIK
nr:helicase-related protein [Candidatus Vampirococcus lugosii]